MVRWEAQPGRTRCTTLYDGGRNTAVSASATMYGMDRAENADPGPFSKDTADMDTRLRRDEERVRDLTGPAPIPGDQRVMGKIIEQTLARRARERLAGLTRAQS